MSRYGICEWYGHRFSGLSGEDRRRLAHVALGDGEEACPFQSPGTICRKKGGVCSIQLADEHPAIVCPRRFEQDRVLLFWMADIFGFSAESVHVAREVPFKRDPTSGKAAGRIDLVVTSDRDATRWYGLEIQAVYFSGASMGPEFQALADDPNGPHPIGNRRPDWRSSGAKRLMPQVASKAETLRRWNSKLAVAVDPSFFASLGGPSRNATQDINDGDIVWMIPEIRGGRLRRGHWEVLTLEGSRSRLLASEDIRRSEFESMLRGKLEPLVEAP